MKCWKIKLQMISMYNILPLETQERFIARRSSYGIHRLQTIALLTNKLLKQVKWNLTKLCEYYLAPHHMLGKFLNVEMNGRFHPIQHHSPLSSLYLSDRDHLDPLPRLRWRLRLR